MTNPPVAPTIATRTRAAASESQQGSNEASDTFAAQSVSATSGPEPSVPATPVPPVIDLSQDTTEAQPQETSSSNMDVDRDLSTQHFSINDNPIVVENNGEITEKNLDIMFNKFKEEVNALIIKLTLATAASPRDSQLCDGLHRELSLRKAILQTLMESSKLSMKDHEPIVPNNLPVFKWNTTTVTDTDFYNLKECFTRFEDVLNSHNLNLDKHWKRLIVFCLSVEQRAWLDDFVDENIIDKHNIKYETLNVAFIQNYGITMAGE